uniref:Uncharacterized protein n=1 Tax=Arundo donax TaxID=35708 RepID=A0A0A9DXI0_ARUDO
MHQHVLQAIKWYSHQKSNNTLLNWWLAKSTNKHSTNMAENKFNLIQARTNIYIHCICGILNPQLLYP